MNPNDVAMFHKDLVNIYEALNGLQVLLVAASIWIILKMK